MKKIKSTSVILFSVFVLIVYIFCFTSFGQSNLISGFLKLAQNSARACFSLQNDALFSLQCNTTPVEEKTVFLGGDTLGFEYNTEGVLVVGKNKLYKDGVFFDNIADDAILEGDLITQVDGQAVKSASEISNILNQREEKDKEVEIVATRKGKDYQTKLKPAYDVLTKKYKLGLWVKNKINGIGTLTYIDAKNQRFGSLGHGIVNQDSNSIIPVFDGDIYACSVLGIKRAARGSAGELRGILKMNTSYGCINKNITTGIYGVVDNEEFINNRTEIEVGGKHTVVPGKALIYCSIDGKTVRAYDIEIIKTNFSSSSNKDMILKVTDKRLISATGGIVQGMSGSPIVQNGKLVGAVTHVFLNDATKGFGIFIDNMLKN